MTDTLPRLSESTVRQRATDQSWARGLRYFKDGQVSDVVWRGDMLTAEVAGSDYVPYRVNVFFEGEAITSATCSCPYAWDGDCKHIVAALLTLLQERDRITVHPPLDELLADVGRDQLISLLQEVAAAHPELVDALERALLNASIPSRMQPGDSPPEIDLGLLRRQITSEVPASILGGYDSWGEERFYDSDLGAALEPAQKQAEAYLAAGKARQALALLDAATEAWSGAIDKLDDYVIEAFDDFAGDFTYELGLLWAEAVLSANLDEAEQANWAERLTELSESMFGGYALSIAATAAEQGWNDPPLVAAMDGNITEKGAWEGDAPEFADELAAIRLRVLERRGEYDAYLNLAQAEGQFLSYLHMLIKRNQSDKALSEALEYVTHPSEFHALAKTFLGEGEVEKAFELARHGLSLAESQGKAELAGWLRDQARAQQDAELALWAAQRALEERVTLDNYRTLEESAGDGWETFRPEALEIVARGNGPDGQVDVYLHEAMYPQAIKIVDQATWFSNINKVIEAVKADHPEWAFHQCRRRAEEIMDAGRAKDYDVATDWLRRGRDILVAAGEQKKWASYLDELMEEHHRKYKLMPMLKGLRGG